jgi:hypothetical protein
MKKTFDIILCIASLAYILFLVINWNGGGYGWAGVFAFHWLISICLAIVWIVLFVRNKTSRGMLTYLSIALLLSSFVLDYVWMKNASW